MSEPNNINYQREIITNIIPTSLAGVISRIACHPIDTCKSRLQAYDGYRSLTDVIISTYRQNGIKGFYSGVTTTAIGSAPGVFLYLTSYDKAKNYLSNYINPTNPIVHLSAGIIAEAICGSVFVPIDVVKERLQVQTINKGTNGYFYKNSIHAFQTILRDEGLLGLYKGYWVTLFSFGPFSAIYFSLYENFKRRIIKEYNECSLFHSFVGSALAGSIASFLTNPLEIVKLRFQVQKSSKNIFKEFRSILNKHGVRGLFRGAGTRIIFHTPSTAITMAVYEESRKFINKLYDSH